MRTIRSCLTASQGNIRAMNTKETSGDSAGDAGAQGQAATQKAEYEKEYAA